MDDRHVFGSFGRGRGLLSSGYSSDRVGSRSILKTPQEFEASAPRRLSFFGSSHGRGRSVHMEMGDLDGPFGRSFNMDRHGEDHEDPSHCDRFDLDPVRNTREESLSTPPKSDPDEGLNSLVRVMKSLNENFEKQGYKGSHLPFKIDKFDGKTGSQLKPFLAKFEIMAKRGQWNEDMKADMLKCNLTGAAAQLLWDDPNCQSYEQLVMKLNQRFGEENQAECFRAKLKVRKQGRDESLSSLMQDIRRMMILAYPDSSSELGRIMSKDCFLDAIFDKNLSLKVREHSPVDLDAAFQLAVKFEAYAQLSGPAKGEDKYKGGKVQAVASSNPSNEYVSENSWNNMMTFQNNLMKQLESQGNQISMLSKQVQGLVSGPSYPSKEQVNPSSSFKRQIKCFGCGEPDHILTKCPHKKNNKIKSNENKPSTGSEPEVAGVSAVCGALIIQAVVNGKKLQCLVDTGSEVSLINESLICTDDLKVSNRTLKAANGSPIAVSGVIEIPLFLGSHQYQSSFIVSPQIQNVILGLDWLEMHGCLIDCKNLSLIIGDHRFKLKHLRAENMCRRIEASHDIVLPGRSQVNVEARVVLPHLKGSGEYWMTETDSESKEWQLAHTLVSRGDGVVPIRLLNAGVNAVTIPKGQEIGRLVEVEVPAPSQNDLDALDEEQERVLNEMVERVDSEVTGEDKQRLRNLLMKYKGAISWNEYDLGYTDLVQHSIPTTDGPPVRQKLRRFPPAHAAIIDKQVDIMLKQGIIEPSTSEWSSNVVIVKKKDVRGPDGSLLPPSYRFCIDFRPLNGRSVQKLVYPLPNTQDCLDSMSGCSWFSTIDLRSGYFQVALRPEDAHKTNFMTRRGSWSYRVMAQGLLNATATFMRLMNLVLSGLQFEQVVCYLDDILVFADSLETHFSRLEEVLKRLQQAGLKIRPDKCELLQRKVRFLGYVVQGSGISVDPAKTEVVKNWPAPRNVSEVRSFTGFCQYYSRMLFQYARTAQPLYDLTRKNVPFVWSVECQQAFDKLKSMLIEAPIVGFPRESGEFILDTDACDKSIGAVLSQMQDGIEVVICYGSKVLSRAETNYTVTRRELLAIVFFMERFRQYLLGAKFLVRTDHSALSYLQRAPNLMGQQARWQEKLSCFTFDIVHRSGAKHGNADGVSRIPCSENDVSDSHSSDLCAHIHDLGGDESGCSELFIQGWDWASLQKSDPDLEEVYEAFKLSPDERPCKNVILGWSEEGKILSTFWSSLCLKNDVLYRDHPQPDGRILHQVIVPKSLRTDVCRLAHCGITGGHLGEDRTREQLKRRCYFPGWSVFLKSFLKACANCAQYFRGKPPRQGELQPFSVGGPGELVSIDVTGPHPKTNRGNVYILTCQDYFSKWVECFALPNQEAELVARVLVEQVFCRYGFPARLLSDKGSNFESRLFQEMCRVMGVTKLRTSSYRASCNGLIERFHRCLHAMLAKVMSDNQKDWDLYLPFALASYRGTVHSTTNFTPNFLLFGKENRAPMDLVFGSPSDERVVDSEHEYVRGMQERMAKSYSLVRKNMKVAAERRKVKYDAFVRDGTKFQPGQLVYYYYPRRFQGKSFKFQKIYTGPWKIVEQTGPVNYRILKVSAKTPGPQSQVVHVDKLKLVHVEQDLVEPSGIPDPEPAPPLPSELDGVRPRRVIVKPRRIADDYVFCLLEDQEDMSTFKCHLCGRPPFVIRKAWKTHLYLVHGISSSNIAESVAMKVASSVAESPQACSSIEHTEDAPVYENISDGETEDAEVVTSMDGVAVVASISCVVSDTMSEEEDCVAESSVGNLDPMMMDEAIKVRELRIVETLIRRIHEHGLPTLSAPLVSSMKLVFPDLTTERINAMFQWTVRMQRMHEARSGDGLIEVEKKSVESQTLSTEVVGSSSPRMDSSCPNRSLDSLELWDPCLAATSTPHEKRNESSYTKDVRGLLSSGTSSPEIGSFVSVDPVPSVNVVADSRDSLRELFPELYVDVEEEFDLC